MALRDMKFFRLGLYHYERECAVSTNIFPTHVLNRYQVRHSGRLGRSCVEKLVLPTIVLHPYTSSCLERPCSRKLVQHWVGTLGHDARAHARQSKLILGSLVLKTLTHGSLITTSP